MAKLESGDMKLTTEWMARIARVLEWWRDDVADDGVSCAVGTLQMHGTGTALGDPIEVGAALSVLGGSSDCGALSLQALKSCIGHTECGAGVFMANHFDRHYCGKCGLTYVYENK